MSVIDDLIRREGGFVYNSADRGKATKYGITQATLSDWRGKDVSVDDVANLTEAEAREIYAKKYIATPHFDRINDEHLQELLIDSGVDCGPQRSIQWLQNALGVAADGNIGPNTMAVLARSNVQQIYNRVLAQRIRYYTRLATGDHSQLTFLNGWIDRALEFLTPA